MSKDLGNNNPFKAGNNQMSATNAFKKATGAPQPGTGPNINANLSPQTPNTQAPQFGATSNPLNKSNPFNNKPSGQNANTQAEQSQSGENEAEGSGVISFVNNIIENAVLLKVSDIHIEPYKGSSRLRYRRDGGLKEVEEYRNFLHQNYSAITTRVKILASLDISERRLPQDGAISFPYMNGFVDIRVSVLPTGAGERIVMRIMDKTSLTRPLDELGFPESVLPKIRKAIASPQGMILVTGPTGSGKSTTLYAVLNALNDPDVNILTAEDPVEFEVSGIGQVAVKDHIGLTFAAALRSFLRQDPEIIMVGEIRDKDTGDISVKASLTGHLVLSTLHTNSAPGTITRLLNMGIPGYLLASSLTLIIAQRLAKVICPDCKKEDSSVTTEMLMSIGFTEEDANNTKTYIGAGCDNCFNTGTKGRRAIHEVLVVTKNIKEAILNDKNDLELMEIAETKDGFLSMQNRGRQLMSEGIISLKEYQRVLVVDD